MTNFVVMKNTWFRFLVLGFVIVGAFILSSSSYGQCPMCRSAVESAMQQEGNTIGLGLNKGILYLLATPYLLVAIVGTIWYRNNKKRVA